MKPDTVRLCVCGMFAALTAFTAYMGLAGLASACALVAFLVAP